MTIAVVTGAAGGIGQALNRALGAAGYEVAVVDIDPGRCEPVVSELLAAGYKAFAAAADLRSRDAVQRMAGLITDRGAVSVLVNNAGVASAPTFAAADEADWQAALDNNVTGAFRMTKAFLPTMQAAGKGVIINIASTNGFGVYGNPSYSVAKAALLHLTRQIAVEYGPYGIRAVSVVPASVRTPAWDHRLAHNPKVFDEILKFYPLRRIVEPQDVASVVAFVVSDAARAITGSEILVDCGTRAGNTLVADIITEADSKGVATESD